MQLTQKHTFTMQNNKMPQKTVACVGSLNRLNNKYRAEIMQIMQEVLHAPCEWFFSDNYIKSGALTRSHFRRFEGLRSYGWYHCVRSQWPVSNLFKVKSLHY